MRNFLIGLPVRFGASGRSFDTDLFCGPVHWVAVADTTDSVARGNSIVTSDRAQESKFGKNISRFILLNLPSHRRVEVSLRGRIRRPERESNLGPQSWINRFVSPFNPAGLHGFRESVMSAYF
ncbi:jg4227 [Pararge aegeria aegeria]|uniref:Jg4227 protein n=1 Tax=Pararge aegeria aegeria TaxID=348720 RepID=A0A8S4R3T0_9NEOP|nr:jg4227 [Pararge aegeria aegeria]